jgi:hypothetical protein
VWLTELSLMPNAIAATTSWLMSVQSKPESAFLAVMSAPASYEQSVDLSASHRRCVAFESQQTEPLSRSNSCYGEM